MSPHCLPASREVQGMCSSAGLGKPTLQCRDFQEELTSSGWDEDGSV